MKYIIFICLITQLFGNLYYIKKYEASPYIYRGSGLVILDLSEFKEGDSIYITYDSHYNTYTRTIYYNFTKDYPSWENPNLLQGRKDSYSDGSTSYKHNVSDGYGGYRIYYTYDYHYFFEFQKPYNESANYLLLGYDLTGYRMDSIQVDNTRFKRYIKTVIIVFSIIGGILFFAGIYFLFSIRDKIADCFSDCFSCLTCPSRSDYHSYSPPVIREEPKSFKLAADSPSTEMISKKYDNTDELPEGHPDYIKPSDETPQYCPPPQDNLIDKPVPNVNIIQPMSQNIVVDTPQQDLGPIPPPVYPPPENINYQTPPPAQPQEYPSQENIQNNPVPPSNQENNIPSDNNDNYCILQDNQEQIQQQDNNDNQNPPQNEENNNSGYTGGGGIYQ